MLYVVMVRVVLFLHFIPGIIGFLLIFMDYKWVFDSLELLNDFLGLLSVVGILGFVSGLTGFGRDWALGLMPGSGLILFLLLPSLLSRTLRLSRLRFWLSLISVILSSVRPGCLFFCRSGHPVVTPDQFLNFVGHLLPQEPQFDLPRITGRDLQEVARAKKVYCWGTRWLGME